LIEREAAAMSDDDIVEEARLLAELNQDSEPCEFAEGGGQEQPAEP
jgi:hypothetical protein